MSHPLPPRPPAQTDDRILGRRYTVLSRLGAGAGGVTDLVEDTRLGVRRVAKRVSLEDYAGCARLRQEYSLRAGLHHPALPRPVDLAVDREHEALVLVSAFALGDDLDRALEEATPEAVLRLLAQALGALDHIHGRGVIHRDLKPRNIVAHIEGDRVSLALLDFGLSRRMEEPEGDGGGTAGFVAPEVLAGAPSTPSSDLFALGRTFAHATPPAGRSKAFDEVVRALCEEGARARLRTAPAALGLLTRLAPESTKAVPAATRPSYRVPNVLWSTLVGHADRSEVYGSKTPAHIVVGRGGSGRSRLLEEFRHEALVRGSHVLVCGGEITRTGLDGLAAFVEHLGRVPSPALDLEEIRATAHALRTAESGGRLPAGLQRDVARLLGEAGRGHPLVVLLDDLRPHDGPLWGCLRALPRGDARGPLVVATLLARDESTPLSIARAALATRLDPDDVLGWYDLPEPSGDTVAHILRDLTPPGMASAERPAWMAGVASLVGRDLRLAVLLGREPTGSTPGSPAAPDALEHLVSSRARGLDAPTRAVLEAVALLEIPSRIGLVARIAGLDPADTLASIKALVARGLVRTEAAASDPLVWIDLRVVRRLVLDGLSTEQLQARHEAVLEHLLAWPYDRERASEVLAHHALEADRADDAVLHGRNALRVLLREGELGAAQVLGARVLARVPGGTSSTWFDLLEAYLESLVRTAHLEEARTLARQALARAEDAALAGHRARILGQLGAMALQAGDPREAERTIAEALDVGGDALAVVPKMLLLERLGAARFRRGAFAEARSVWQRGLDIPGAPSAHRLRGDLLNNLAVVARALGQMEEARALFDQSLVLRRGIGDLDGEAITLGNLGLLHADAGDLPRALARAEEVSRRAERLGAHRRARSSALNAAEWSMRQGRLDEARSWMARASEHARGTKVRRLDLSAVQLRFNAACFEGQWGRAIEEATRFRNLAQDPTPAERIRTRGIAAELAVVLGDAAALDEALQPTEGEGEKVAEGTWAWFLRLRAHAATLRGDPQGALAILATVDALEVSSINVRERLDTDMERAFALERIGSYDKALDVLEGCRPTARTMASDLKLGWLALASSRVALARTRFDAAADLLQEASLCAERIGCLELKFDVAAQKGHQAWLRGQPRRARVWWQSAGALVLQALDTLPDRTRDANILGDPRRAWVFNALSRLVDGGASRESARE